MRLEKINERQIRCTLNQKDLKDREIGITELAYGTPKAKALFRDMMEQASYEFGFDAENIPLMIEAIPLLPEALVLVITKVEDPDELDTRFSCFTEEDEWADAEEGQYLYDDFEMAHEYSGEYEYDPSQEMEEHESWEYAESVISNGFSEWKPQAIPDTSDFISLPEALGMEPKPANTLQQSPPDVVMIFSFDTLDSVIMACKLISSLYKEENTLYKDSAAGSFYLVLHRKDLAPERFSKICNLLYEYGTPIKNNGARQFYMAEHYQSIIAKNAVAALAEI